MLYLKKTTPNSYLFFLILLLSSLVTNQVSAQSFDWCDDGYSNGVSNYTDIDNSTIDIEILGLENEYCSDIAGEPTITTGINDLLSLGVQHEYTFKFSETVDVSFYIYNINKNEGWNDRLVFTGSPNFYFSSAVTFGPGNVVYPPSGTLDYNGYLGVSFENVDSVSFTHGSGTYHNPGYIHIGSLVFGKSLAGIDQHESPHYLMTQTESSIKFKELKSTPSTVSLVNSVGQSIQPLYEWQNDELEVYSNDLASGMYFIQFVLEDGNLVRDKFVIR